MDVIFSFFLKALNFHFGSGILCGLSRLLFTPPIFPSSWHKCIKNNKCAKWSGAEMVVKWSKLDKKPARMCQYASLVTPFSHFPLLEEEEGFFPAHRHGHCKLMAFKVVKQQEMQFAGRLPFVGHQLIASTKEWRRIL